MKEMLLEKVADVPTNIDELNAFWNAVQIPEKEEKDVINDEITELLGEGFVNEDKIIADALVNYGNDIGFNRVIKPLVDLGYDLELEKATFKPNEDGTKSEEQAPMKNNFWYYIKLGNLTRAYPFWAYQIFINKVKLHGLMVALLEYKVY